jgi:hypothetical protein
MKNSATASAVTVIDFRLLVFLMAQTRIHIGSQGVRDQYPRMVLRGRA